MNKNIGIVSGVIVLVVIVGAVYASMSNKDDVMMKDKVEETTNMEDKVGEMKVDNTEDDVSMMDKGGVMMKGSYELYSPEKLARAETGDVVLFFHASWCPSCRALNSDIESNITSIPEGVSILKVDYDKETELKKKYGVTYQHTLVQVDKDGNLIKKWSGSSKLANLISEIQ
jgi:thioredoxin 1